jgi:hypothetical protein
MLEKSRLLVDAQFSGGFGWLAALLVFIAVIGVM